jgi:hypothetical protein
LLDLVAVHGFYLSLLENLTGEPVPTPRGTLKEEHAGTPVENSISVLRRWLNILDMAISPPMFRDALRETLDPATTEALLRYYVLKTSHTDVDRDKCDFINTFLYRGWRKQQGLPPAPSEAIEITPDHVLAYEGEIFVMLGDVEPPAIAEEHAQLTREFDPLRAEVDEFYHFDKLMDSAIIGRVRDIKHSFMKSFYHPHVLAEVAVYNAFFGHKFDELFGKAAAEIKSFAHGVTEGGGSIMTRVNDDVTVKDITDLHEDEILHEEYGKARDKLRKVAMFKKAVDTRRRGRFGGPAPSGPGFTAAVGAQSGSNVVPINTAATAAAAVPSVPVPPMLEPRPNEIMHPSDLSPHGSLASINKVEDNKIANASDMIRNFILAADKTFSNNVPLRSGSILLTPAEVDAFRNAYLDEKSFRSDYAAMVRQLVAMMAVLMLELEDYKRKKDSAYLWKQHADSLKYFVSSKLPEINNQANEMRVLCEKRGLAGKVQVLDLTLDRLRKHVHEVAKFLQA